MEMELLSVIGKFAVLFLCCVFVYFWYIYRELAKMKKKQVASFSEEKEEALKVLKNLFKKLAEKRKIVFCKNVFELRLNVESLGDCIWVYGALEVDGVYKDRVRSVLYKLEKYQDVEGQVKHFFEGSYEDLCFFATLFQQSNSSFKDGVLMARGLIEELDKLEEITQEAEPLADETVVFS